MKACSATTTGFFLVTVLACLSSFDVVYSQVDATKTEHELYDHPSLRSREELVVTTEETGDHAKAEEAYHNGLMGLSYRQRQRLNRDRKNAAKRDRRKLKPKSDSSSSSKSSKSDSRSSDDRVTTTNIVVVPRPTAPTPATPPPTPPPTNAQGGVETPSPTPAPTPSARPASDLVNFRNGFLCPPIPFFMSQNSSPSGSFNGQYPELVPLNSNDPQSLCYLRMTPDTPANFASSSFKSFSLNPNNDNMQMSMEVGTFRSFL